MAYFTEDELNQALGIFQASEEDYLTDPDFGYANPRRCVGLAALDIATAMGWTTGILRNDGRFEADIPRAQALINLLVKEHRLEPVSPRGTARARRSSRFRYATPGFAERLSEKQQGAAA
jgi:hypothetical protein